MTYQEIFERHELKFFLTQEEKHKLCKVMAEYMDPDEFFKSDIRNIYYDTPNKWMIRDSLIKPNHYKEKLRVRCYGPVKPQDHVFVEIKKKYKGIVYKRRIALEEQIVSNYLNQDVPVTEPNQITREIDYLKFYYKGIEPSIFLAYQREAYISKTDLNFRMTFDENIVTRKYDLTLTADVYGEPDMLDGNVILEVKTVLGIPKWLVDFFSENQIYKRPFSKYGNAYLGTMLARYLAKVE